MQADAIQGASRGGPALAPSEGAPESPAAAAPDRGPTRVVALDGPAGSGKSTVARLVAKALGWRFVDTGATYRAVTLAVLRAGVDPQDAEGVLRVVQAAQVELVSDPDRPQVLLDGEDVSALVRGADVTAAVSAVAAIPAVRTLLIALQRKAMGDTGSVTEGRDISTVVAPDAAVKVYLDASPDVRARRRAAEQPLPPATTEHQQAVAADLARRDQVDSRTNAFEPSEGAVHLETSELDLGQVVAAVVGLVEQAGLHPSSP